MHIKQTHISSTQPNLLKEHVSTAQEKTVVIKHENTTWYIKHLAESANFKGGTFNKLCSGLTVNRFEMPNVSYTHPLCPIVKQTANDNKNTDNHYDMCYF